MRKVIFLLIIILSLPNTLWAADPIIGTWRLNIEKSKLQTTPKEQTDAARDSYRRRDRADCIKMDRDSGVTHDGKRDPETDPHGRTVKTTSCRTG